MDESGCLSFGWNVRNSDTKLQSRKLSGQAPERRFSFAPPVLVVGDWMSVIHWSLVFGFWTFWPGKFLNAARKGGRCCDRGRYRGRSHPAGGYLRFQSFPSALPAVLMVSTPLRNHRRGGLRA